MPLKSFIDPYGARLPALERNVIKLRAFQMLLIIFYVEELKRGVLDRIQTTDSTARKLGSVSGKPERVPKGTKNSVEKALRALVADKAITLKDKSEIVELIDFRNAIGHDIQSLLADMSSHRFARELVKTTKPYRYDAVARARHFLKLLNDLYRTHHYVRTFDVSALLFRSAEQTLLTEIKQLQRKIRSLAKKRSVEIRLLNAELPLAGTALVNDFYPLSPYSKYDNGRLTKLGVEICYRLFELDKSAMAVAHLMALSLAAVRKRLRMWHAIGGPNRTAMDFATIPKRRFRARTGD